MAVLVQFDFSYPSEMMGDALAEMATPLAHSITQEPGFISKIWTENPTTGEAGGIYLFEDQATAEAYATMHTDRVLGMGAANLRCKIFMINETLTKITHGIA